MSKTNYPDPDQYVRENRNTLVEIIKHSNDTFVRALCLAALVEYGDTPDVEGVRAELDAFIEQGSEKQR